MFWGEMVLAFLAEFWWRRESTSRPERGLASFRLRFRLRTLEGTLEGVSLANGRIWTTAIDTHDEYTFFDVCCCY